VMYHIMCDEEMRDEWGKGTRECFRSAWECQRVKLLPCIKWPHLPCIKWPHLPCIKWPHLPCIKWPHLPHFWDLALLSTLQLISYFGVNFLLRNPLHGISCTGSPETVEVSSERFGLL
jgi:hypothetical protein